MQVVPIDRRVPQRIPELQAPILMTTLQCGPQVLPGLALNSSRTSQTF